MSDITWKEAIGKILEDKRNKAFDMIHELVFDDCKKMIISRYGKRIAQGDENTIFWYAFTSFYQLCSDEKFRYQNESASESYFKSTCNYTAKKIVEIYKKEGSGHDIAVIQESSTESVNKMLKKNGIPLELEEDETSMVLDRLIKVFRLVELNEERKFIFLVKTYNKKVRKNFLKINNKKIYDILYPFYDFKISGINKMNQYFKNKLFKMMKNYKYSINRN